MNISWWEWGVLILTLLVIGGLLWAYYGAPNIRSWKIDLKSTSLDDLLTKADNGDLLLLAGDTRGERACRWASDSVFSHVGLLFREPHPQTKENLLYIWEADIGQGSKKGPRVMLVRDKLQRYGGIRILGWRPCIGKRPSTEEILKVVEKHASKSLDSQMWSWIFSDIPPLRRWIKDENKVFCSELLGLTLQDLKMMDRSVIACSLSPEDFHTRAPPGLSSAYGDVSYIIF